MNEISRGNKNKGILLELDNSIPRKDTCLINAKNDLDAVKEWLSQYKRSKNTFALYKREAKRLLLWSSKIKKKPFSKLKVSDLEDFLFFLQDPPKEWITNKSEIKLSRTNLGWKVFCDGGLKGSSFNTSIRVVKSLFSFLSDSNYLSGNPFRLLKNYTRLSISSSAMKLDVKKRMLSSNEWDKFLQTLNELPENSYRDVEVKKRTQFVVAMLYYLGLRLSELSNSSWNAFVKEEDKWWFYVIGKGGKHSMIPTNNKLMDIVFAFRSFKGMEVVPGIHDTENIINISESQIYKDIKKVGKLASLCFPDGSNSRDKLQALSPHWLRHLSASHQDALGVPATAIKENHRHGSFLTTQIYLHAEDESRHNEIQKLSANINFSKININNSAELSITVKNHSLNPDSTERFFSSIEKFLLKDAKVKDSEVRAELSKRLYNIPFVDDSLKDKIELEADMRLLDIDILVSDVASY